MKRRFMQFVTVFLAMTLCVPNVWAAKTNQNGEIMIRVGLASSSTHNSAGELACAQLENNTGYGSGYRFGYFDSNLNFIELAHTDKNVTQIAMLKTQNMYYGYDSTASKYTYSDSITSDIVVGCYHIQIPGSYTTYEDAAADAELYGGFVAWIDGKYQVRVGAYQSKSGAEGALATMGQGTIVGTSSYGISVVQTGTDRILFQYDNGASSALGVMPDVTGATDVRTWFLGLKYRGGFTYQRISGGNLTVVNVLNLEDYVRGVVCYEMGREWPLEALKAQAICARTYAIKRLGYHNSLGFDVCNSDWCQVYQGVGSKRTDYGPSAVSDQAVEETAGQVLWYKDQLADTYYASSHGGASESAYYIWGTDMEKYPYLCGVEDPYEELVADRNQNSSWTVEYTAEELESRLKSYGLVRGTSLDHLELKYSDLGNVIEVKLCYANGQSNVISQRTNVTIRTAFNLKSIRFTVNDQTVTPGNENTFGGNTSFGSQKGYAVNGEEWLEDLDGLYTISGTGTTSKISEDPHSISGDGTVAPVEESSGSSGGSSGSNQGGGTVVVSGDRYVFQGGGWGHQIGMSQFGANAMARSGFTGEEIVEFYFPGTYVDDYQ
jgi:stage II sporulation protein D